MTQSTRIGLLDQTTKKQLCITTWAKEPSKFRFTIFWCFNHKKHGIYLRAIWKSSGALYGIIFRGMGMEKIGDPNHT